MKKPIAIALALLVAVGAGVVGVRAVFAWEVHNRITGNCVWVFLTSGLLGNRGPGAAAHLDALSEGRYPFPLRDHYGSEEEAKTMTARYRYAFLLRNTEHYDCAPLSEEKYAQTLERITAERGWPEAQYLLALRYGYGGFVNGALGYENAHDFDFLIDDGVPRSPIANAHGNGKGLDLEKSFALLERSAQGGFGLAQWVLSRVYATGVWGKDNALKVGVDWGKSTQWLEAFVAAEHSRYSEQYDVHYQLAYRLRNAAQYGLQPDDARAAELFQTAVETGRRPIDAALELARMHKQGAGVPRSDTEARAWLAKAEEKIESEANLWRTYYANQPQKLAAVDAAKVHYQQKLTEARVAIEAAAD